MDNADGQRYNLYICAVDKNGTTSSVVSGEVKFDFNYPTLTVSGDEEITTKDELTLTGTTWDASGISSLSITEGTTSFVYELDSLNPGLENCKTETNSGWTIKFPVGSAEGTNKLADGKHTVLIKAEDAAHKITSLTKTILVDTKKPAVTLNGTPNKDETLAAQVTISGTASDSVSGITTSGVSPLYQSKCSLQAYQL